MAIFKGTWLSDAGVPFDPASFPISQTIIPPFSAITVTGTLTPDATGLYKSAGTYGGLPYWKHDTEEFYLYWLEAPRAWYICNTLNAAPTNFWSGQYWFQRILAHAGTYTGHPYLFLELPPTIEITGTCTPDATGTYTATGTEAGFPLYTRTDSAFIYYYHTASNRWALHAPPTGLPAHYHFRLSNPQGGMLTVGNNTGYPTALQTPDSTIIVTGTGIPEVTGTYTVGGVYNLAPYWKHNAAEWYIFKHPTLPHWVFSAALGTLAPAWSTVTGPSGFYPIPMGYTGNPIANFDPPAIYVPSHGVCRLKISGRRAGSGTRAGWYPAGPGFPAGIYRESPWMRHARGKWAAMMKVYAQMEPREIFRVNTMYEQAHVLCLDAPDITGYYAQLLGPPNMSPWRWAATAWHIWWDNALSKWFLADTYPAAPGPADRYYERADVAWYGDYDPGGTAAAVAEVTSVTFDGRYFYVGQHDGNVHYYNKYRNAHIWYSAIPDIIILADTFPNDPGGGDLWWSPAFNLYTWKYDPQGIAAGDAIVDALE